MVVVVCAICYAVDVRGVEFFAPGCKGREEGEYIILGVATDPGAAHTISLTPLRLHINIRMAKVEMGTREYGRRGNRKQYTVYR